VTDDCDPTYGKVDRILELLTKSKSLHILMVLDRSDAPLRFTEIKSLVDASSTTVSRRIKELEDNRLIVRSMNPESPQNNLYALSEDGRDLSPIMQRLFDWAEEWKD
jgi:DNA-binding HxlR family transcriptional regulator